MPLESLNLKIDANFHDIIRIGLCLLICIWRLPCGLDNNKLFSESVIPRFRLTLKTYLCIIHRKIMMDIKAISGISIVLSNYDFFDWNVFALFAFSFKSLVRFLYLMILQIYLCTVYGVLKLFIISENEFGLNTVKVSSSLFFLSL